MPEMHDHLPKILAVLLHAVIQIFNVRLLQKSKHFLFQLPAPLAGNDLNIICSLFDRLPDNTIECCIQLAGVVENIVEVEDEAHNGTKIKLDKTSYFLSWINCH